MTTVLPRGYKINVYSRNGGWLFEDLKMEIAACGAIPSDKPLPDCDAYICIRTREWVDSPKPEKTVVQIHDVTSEIPKAGMLSFMHESQLERGYSGEYIVHPIGSRNPIHSVKSGKPVIGMFCREYFEGRREVKETSLFAQAVEMAKKECDFDVLLVGRRLDHIAHVGKYEKRGAGMGDYTRVNALVFTGVNSTMIPISAYEAAANGIAVIDRDVKQWPFEYEGRHPVGNVNDMAAAIVSVVKNGRSYKPAMPYTRRDWARKQMECALKLLCR